LYDLKVFQLCNGNLDFFAAEILENNFKLISPCYFSAEVFELIGNRKGFLEYSRSIWSSRKLKEEIRLAQLLKN